jgi:hypothetical protein
MKEQDVPPLDDDVRALLRAAGTTPPAPTEARSRVRAHVEATGAMPAPRLHLGRLAAAFAVGTGLGVAVGRATVHAPPPIVEQAPPRIVYVDRPAPPVPAPSATAAGADLREPSRGAAPPALPRLAAPASSVDSLTAERALLDVARGALAREDNDAALAAAREHERRFPDGVLAQEREAMAVRALALLGRTSDARARADRFRTRFPRSVLLPAIEASLAGSPASDDKNGADVPREE